MNHVLNSSLAQGRNLLQSFCHSLRFGDCSTVEIKGEKRGDVSKMASHVKLLVDIGSTFTKVVAVDLVREEIVSRVEYPSTVEDDDLSEVTKVVGTGGPIAFSSFPEKILRGVIADPEQPYLLKPKKVDFYVDEKYILYAMGLLAKKEPGKALRIMKTYLNPVKRSG